MSHPQHEPDRGAPAASEQLAPVDAEMPAEALREALNRIARDSLRPVALMLSVLYLLEAGALLAGHSGEALPGLIALALALSLVSLALFVALGRGALPTGWAHATGSALALLAITVMTARHLTTSPSYTLSYALLLITAGYLYLDTRWLTLAIAAALGAWVGITLRLYPDISVDELAPTVVTSVAIALVVHFIRLRTLRRLERAHFREARYRTAWQQAAGQARLSEERFRRLADASLEGVVLHSNDVILDGNQAILNMLGVTMDELLGRHPLDFIAPSVRDSVRQRLAEGHERAYEAVGLRRDGSEFPVEISAREIRVGDQRMRVAVVRDITERKQNEVEREQLIAELNAFAHTVAHDLKNPLSLLVAYADLLYDDLERQPLERLREYISGLMDGAQKMERIIDELLLLAQTHQGAATTMPVQMSSIVAEACHVLRPAIERTGAQISVQAEWPPALGYGPWLEHVWTNYLGNALKYGGNPPRIELGADEQPGGIVRFWVRDHGQGIGADQQAEIFEPFKRGQRIRRDGYGIGLSIVQRIVTRLGGQVGVESTEGGGSTFYFTLPRAPMPEQSLPSPR
ncbi:MAG: PAS domain S-box protein [Anaerolineae bacterium]|nr:PAS domain S-box protein [Anaerolineae bacterium]